MAIIVFYTSLFLLIGMITMKSFGVSLFSHRKMVAIVHKNEKHLHKIKTESIGLASKIRFENFHKVVVISANFIKKETILLKKKLDSQQPKFFLKPQKPGSTHKGSVSFFLKDISDYRDSLRRKDL